MTIRKFCTNSLFIPISGLLGLSSVPNEPILDHLIYILPSIAELPALVNRQSLPMRPYLVTSLNGVHHDMCEIWAVRHVIGISAMTDKNMSREGTGSGHPLHRYNPLIPPQRRTRTLTRNASSQQFPRFQLLIHSDFIVCV